MDLREEIKKIEITDDEKEILTKQKQLEENFKSWIENNKLNTEYKEQMYDELQKCLDELSFENCIIKDTLKNQYYKYRNRKRKSEFFKEIELPKELVIVFDKILLNELLNEINILLEKEQITLINENYTVEELENLVIIYTNKMILEGKDYSVFLDEEEKNYETLLNLLYLKAPNHYTLDEFHVSYKIFEIYIKQYFKNNKETNIIREIELENLIKFIGVRVRDIDTLNVGSTKKKAEKGICERIFYLKENEKQALQEYNNIFNESTMWEKTAEKVFEPFILFLEDLFADFDLKELNRNVQGFTLEQISMAESNYDYEQVKKFLYDNKKKIEEAKNKYGISNIILPFSSCLVIFRNNMYANILFEYRKNMGTGLISQIEYNIMSNKDIVEIKEEDRTYTIDVSIPIPKSKKINVTNSALLGNMLGGTGGAIIGATYAMEKNRKNTEIENNYKPILVNANSKEIRLDVHLYLQMKEDWILFANQPEREQCIEKCIQALENARSEKSLLQGEHLKEYISSTNDGDFNESDYKIFAQKRMREVQEKEEKEKQDRIIKYWNEHKEEKEKLLKEQKEINDELVKLEEKILPRKIEIQGIENEFANIENKKNKEIADIEKNIADYKENINELGLFKFKEKKNLKNKIDEMNLNLETKRKENKIYLEKTKNEYYKKVNAIKEIIKPTEDEIEKLENKIKDINEEFSKDRKD